MIYFPRENIRPTPIKGDPKFWRDGILKKFLGDYWKIWDDYR